VVRAVGGLVDTIFDRDFSDMPIEKRNGFAFKDTDAKALESALSRALDLWFNFPGDFLALMQNGMRYDFSWDLPGKKYMEIYERIRCEPKADGNVRT
jgi:starch synthase